MSLLSSESEEALSEIRIEKPNIPDRILFFCGFLIGALLFPMVYGTALLHVTYDSWIFTLPDPDIRQHYLGFLHFIHSDWHFPLGMFDSLSYPHMISVIWTDSIPGICLILKLFRSFLPPLFQFFGWFGLISFGLSGGLAALLVRKITKSTFLSILFVPVIVLSFPVLQRMYYHTSLAAHWIILLSLWIFFSEEEWSLKKRALVWGGMSLLCVMIHSYFLPMAGVIMLAGEILILIRKKGEGKRLLLPVASFCASGILGLFVLGAFAGHVNHDGYSVGGFNANLNTFWNSLGDGLLPPFENKIGTQYEGYAYLGIGILLLCILSFFILVIRLIRRKMQGASLKKMAGQHLYECAVVIMILVFLIVSLVPEVDLGMTTLIPDIMPGFLKRLFGMFRSNGRFIWPAVYLIILSCAYVIKRSLPRAGVVILIFACLLQFLDIYSYASKKNAYFSEEKFFMNPLDQIVLNDVIDRYKHLVVINNENSILMNAGDYAYRNGLTLNRFYFARDINEQVEKTLSQYKEGILPKEDCLFFFYQGSEAGWIDSGLRFYDFGVDGIVLGSVSPIPGLREIY